MLDPRTQCGALMAPKFRSMQSATSLLQNERCRFRLHERSARGENRGAGAPPFPCELQCNLARRGKMPCLAVGATADARAAR
jgi:hypothetical protein